MEEYGMYFSLTFGTGASVRNTWDDWHIIPDSPPVVPPPEPNRRLVEIPGRADGALDLSKYPFGKITYQRTTGSWTFLADPQQDPEVRQILYDNLRRYLHGRTDRVVLEEDESHYFYGFFTVSAPRTGKGPLQISIGYDLEPLRYNVSDDTVDTTWVSDWEE